MLGLFSFFKRLAGENVSEMTYCMLSWTQNLNSVLLLFLDLKVIVRDLRRIFLPKLNKTSDAVKAVLMV